MSTRLNGTDNSAGWRLILLGIRVSFGAVIPAVLCVAITIRSTAVEVVSTSMADTLCAGDYVFVAHLGVLEALRQAGPPDRDLRGRIVIIRRQGYALGHDHDQELLIKRVLAIGNERIQIEDGRVIIDGHVLAESYVRHQPYYESSHDSWPTEAGGVNRGITIPPHQYFVAGDNRDQSVDSRHFGPIHRDEIVGVVVAQWHTVRRRCGSLS